jgi:putative methionine-R-sulfoxide reductase with GAF domain
MRQIKINKDMKYARLLRWYFISFVAICSVMTVVLSISFYYKTERKIKYDQIIYLKQNLTEIDEKLNKSLTKGYLSMHDMFLTFGDFHDDAIEYIGLKDRKKLDSLSKIGAVVKYFDVEKQEKHNLEIVHYLDAMDELLLNTDEKQVYLDIKKNRELSSYGANFKRKWVQTHHLLERSIEQAEEDADLQVNTMKRYIYIISLSFILILCLFVLFLFYVSYYKIINGINTIMLNSSLLIQGKKPVYGREMLSGELEQVNKDIDVLFNDFRAANETLSLFYSEHKMNDEDMERIKGNLFYDSIDNLRNQLKTLENNEFDRNWNLNGVSLLTDIANKYSGDAKELFGQFLMSLVKYTGAVQGGIFVKETEQIMVLEASFAYDRLKKRNLVINQGEGILGEVWAEQKVQYLENIPTDHFYVKSSLGEALPTAIIVVPMIDRGECYGVLEIATFTLMNENKRNFIIKACEILASATANVKVNLKTKNLLRDSQILAEQLKLQEDENLQKIQSLNKDIEEERRKLFLKDTEIKSLRLQIDDLKSVERNLIQEISFKELYFRQEIDQASTKSDVVNQLNQDIEKMKKEIESLQETVHIRNVKIERLKKKLGSDN